MIVSDMDLDQQAVDDSFDDLRLKMDALQATLPSGVQQISVDTNIMDTAGLLLSVTSDQVSGDELSQRTNALKDTLKLLDGVERVDVIGEQISEIAITADIDKLNSMDISLSELSSVIAAQNSLIPTGSIDVEDQTLSVLSNGKYYSGNS